MDNYRNVSESRISARAREKLPSSGKLDADISSWSYDKESHVKECVERYCELAKKTTQQLYKVTAINSKKKNWNVLENCQKSVLSNCHE